MSNDPTSEEGTIELELPQARIRLVGSELIRRDEGDIVVLRLPLKQIEDIRTGSKLSYLGPGFMIFGVGLGAIGIGFCTSPWAIVPLLILGLCSAVLGTFGIFDNGVVLIVGGEQIWISANDDYGVIGGFVASVRARLEQLRESE